MITDRTILTITFRTDLSSAYTALLWIYYAASEGWVYDALDWDANEGAAFALYAALAPALAPALALGCSAAAAREGARRLGAQRAGGARGARRGGGAWWRRCALTWPME
jgi:hypothetical protein